MGINFSLNWASYSGGHLTSQATATTLINNAAAVLAASTQMEVYFWSEAAKSGAPGVLGNYLEVFKGDHQAVGIINVESHLTCAVWIKKKFDSVRHSLYGGAFHLYFQALDPLPMKTKCELQPNKLSYVSLGNVIQTFTITGAAKVDSDQ